jgi:hypothetical protein
VDGHVDRAERGAHVVRLARAVGDAAGGASSDCIVAWSRLAAAAVAAARCRTLSRSGEGARILRSRAAVAAIASSNASCGCLHAVIM